MFLFDNCPRQVSQEFYGIARDQIINYYSKNKDIISIYEYGSVSSPGVSDLDIILVLRDKIDSQEEVFDFSNISNDVYSLVIDGNVIKMPEQVFNKICYFDQLHLKKLFGKDLSLDVLSADDRSILEIISVVDWLPERILRLTRMLNNEVINVSNVLCILHSFSYSIKKINKITGYPEKSDKVLHLIKLLRNDWYALDNPEKLLVQCIKDSVTLGYRYLLKIKKYIESKGLYNHVSVDYSDDLTLELFDNHYIKFVRKELYFDLESDANSISNLSKAFVSIPDFFYPHFYYLSTQDGLLSSVMRDKIKPYIKINEGGLNNKYKSLLTKKINLAEQNAQFLKFNNLKKGLIRYGFHLRH